MHLIFRQRFQPFHFFLTAVVCQETTMKPFKVWNCSGMEKKTVVASLLKMLIEKGGYPPSCVSLIMNAYNRLCSIT